MIAVRFTGWIILLILSIAWPPLGFCLLALIALAMINA